MAKMFHISLNVTNLESSVAFYKKALGVEPAKHHPDYAKFELTDPPLVLSLEPGRGAGQANLNHLGIRVPDGDGLRYFAEKAHLGGLTPQYIQGVECCYSRQTKLCLTDPDNNLVEFYVVEADLEKSTQAVQKSVEQQAANQAASAVWEHLLGTAFPERVDASNASLDEVRLRGTFNIKREPAEATAMLAEARRVLKPSGELMLHLLVSDKALSQKLPRLPGPAALVEHTPTEAEMIRLLEETGFAGITVKRLSHSAVFQFDGADMRELMLTASPKSCSKGTDSYVVVYKGPFREITDDSGVRYIRGNRTAINGETFSTLTHSKLADNFVFLNLTPPTACALPHEPARAGSDAQPSL